jgi:hypothetical protein
MAKDLNVGLPHLSGPRLLIAVQERWRSYLEKTIATHRSAPIKHDLEKWLGAEHGETTICCLNGASVWVFLRHVIRCEGYSDANAGFTAGQNGTSKYSNMPWWDNAVWLPIELEPVTLEPGDPIFVGSSTSPLRELRDLQNVSPIELGSAPEGYEEMRADWRKFYRSVHSGGAARLTDVDCLRWIWVTLRDGADLAIKENTVLYAGPD